MKKITISNVFKMEKRERHSHLFDIFAEGMDGKDDSMNFMEASDGYHTFDELYDHRITLFIALCREIKRWSDIELNGINKTPVWRSKRHSDGELCFGTGTQYVLGIHNIEGKQITYHIPIERWGETDFAFTLESAPKWDGHSSADVLERLKNL